LELKCGKDSAVMLYDDTSDTDRFVRHKLVDTLRTEMGYFVERYFYEGFDWILVSKAFCSTTELFGSVTYNPSKTAFASVSNDNEASFAENGVQIISFENGFPSIELQDKMTTYAGIAWSWSDDSTFSMDIKNLDGKQKKRSYEFREGTWLIRNY
jgi:hypothetical protein